MKKITAVFCGMLLLGNLFFARGQSVFAETEDRVHAASDVLESSSETEVRIDAGERPQYVEQLLAIATGELGYTEGPNNRTKYGEWSGDPNAAWCAEFLGWCVNQVDEIYGTQLLNEIYPKYSGQNTGKDWFVTRGRFVFRRGNCPGWGYQWILGTSELMRKNDYIPKPGDWVFFSYNESGDTEHVAMVEYAAKDADGEVILHVLEGNNPSRVQRNRYYLNNSQVLGFGTPVSEAGTTMRSGNRGEKVLDLQKNLNRLGFLKEQHVTGAYGSNTKSAVADFQRTMGNKSATGIADMETQIAIANEMILLEFHAPDTWMVVD